MGKGKYTLRSIIVRCVVIMVGVFITAYGAEAFVLANLGSDPVTAFVQGQYVPISNTVSYTID